MWRVTATGRDTGATYIYEVDGPADAPEMDIIMSAFRLHGQHKRDGQVTELLLPGATATHTVTPAEWTRDDILAIAARRELQLDADDIIAGPTGWTIDGMAAEDWIDHMEM